MRLRYQARKVEVFVGPEEVKVPHGPTQKFFGKLRAETGPTPV